MSFKTIFSTFLTGQLRAMTPEDRTAFQAKMSEIRQGTLSHHKVLQGSGSSTVLKKVNKETKFNIEEASCGLGGKWRIFFYRTGYVPRNTLEAERRAQALTPLGVPDGTLWCALIGHLEGGDLALFASSTKSKNPGAPTARTTVAERDASIIRSDAARGKTIFKDAIDHLQMTG